jgi:hypothetical protein
MRRNVESIYYVLSWACHRQCEHCYEEKFHPYYGEELRGLAAESERTFARVIGNFPASLTYRDRSEGMREKTGRVILSGGEVLLDAVRETVLYPALRLLRARYGPDGAELIVQTTGDLVTARIARELKDAGADTVSCAGLDEYHDGIDPVRLREKVEPMLEAAGLRAHFFGAEPGSWIGKLWPRGRAWRNGLSTAGMEDNFCNGWSGGLKFLDYGLDGSEVSVDPDGNVFPCCIKTKKPVGSLLNEPLEAILGRLRGNPVYEAISAGRPEQMGVTLGWSEERFHEKCRTRTPDGRDYANLCIGCDAFHEEVLMAAPLVRIEGN